MALVACSSPDPVVPPMPDAQVPMVDEDGDGFTVAAGDCDDSDASLHPGAAELCNERDDDCDDAVDEDATDADLWYADLDGDEFGDASAPVLACSMPPDHIAEGGDCDDTLATVHPGVLERCNGFDDDCDAMTDEPDAVDAPIWYVDADDDGFGDVGRAVRACTAPEGSVADDTDCDDDAAQAHPGGTELCNGLDDDCDGATDEGDAVDSQRWYRDLDRDGFGNASVSVEACSGPPGFVANGDDCNDTNAAVRPGATERCNGRDDNCSAGIDEGAAIDAATWYADADGDGYGDPALSARACVQPAGYLPNAADCDDLHANAHPGGTELCNGLDDDCDGATDEADAVDASSFFPDFDGDGFGDLAAPVLACTQPLAHVTDATDCDDVMLSVFPGATEFCNDLDDDCDGTIDEPEAADVQLWFPDGDADGFGDAAGVLLACDLPVGHVANGDDCDDSLTAVHPGVSETCNGRDDDCDGNTDGVGSLGAPTWYADSDGDGFGVLSGAVAMCVAPPAHVTNHTDCNDTMAEVRPGVSELCNGFDDDCDAIIDEPDAADAGFWFADVDTDGFGDLTTLVAACAAPPGYVDDDTDCDDETLAVNPGATERCNGRDDDCDTLSDEPDAVGAPIWHADADRDTYGDPTTAAPACAQPPGRVANSTDCDDTRAAVHPGAVERCNARDDNCDTVTDESTADDALNWYADTDRDTYGDPAALVRACAAPLDHVSSLTDCDDTRSAVHPGAIELCNTLNDDCDAQTDEADAADAQLWHPDADLDTFGDASTSVRACVAPPGHITNGTDCDDARSSVRPTGTETCNGRDDDCDTLTDEPDAVGAPLWYADVDSDTYGNPTTGLPACSVPPGRVADNTDCNDADINVSPAATESCNGVNDDCNAATLDTGRLDCALVHVCIAGACALDCDPGELDPTFAGGTVVSIDVSGGADAATGVALQPDGRILVTGSASSQTFAVARLLSNGNLDGSFAGDGTVTTAFSDPATSTAVAVQPGRGIVVVGQTYSTCSTTAHQYALARYLDNGTLDPAFGADGLVRSHQGGVDSGLDAVAIQSTGAIVVAGYRNSSTVCSSSATRSAVVRYTPDGLVDTSFASDGEFLIDFPGDRDHARGLVIDATNRLYVAASDHDGVWGGLMRLSAAGVLDLAFGDGGVAVGTANRVDGVALHANGSAALTGGIVALVDGNGALVPGFGAAGFATSVHGDGWNGGDAQAVFDSSGRLLVAGSASGAMRVARYLANGNLDPTFGAGGVATIMIGGFAFGSNSIALQADGQIIVVGQIGDGTAGDFAVARFCD